MVVTMVGVVVYGNGNDIPDDDSSHAAQASTRIKLVI